MKRYLELLKSLFFEEEYEQSNYSKDPSASDRDSFTGSIDPCKKNLEITTTSADAGR